MNERDCSTFQNGRLKDEGGRKGRREGGGGC